MWQDIIQAISSVGFPIACAVAMGVYVKYIGDKNREQISEMNTIHKTEMNSIKEALQNNTIALQKLTDYLEIGGKKNE